MGYYINCIKHSAQISRDVKELIPEMNIRRRMSRVVKMGVTTALDVIADFAPLGDVDAIIVGTGLGCLADSEAFLANMISSETQTLNPTPFIQSTFNTVGAQIALIKSLHCYNNTFSHRYISFESALTDAMIRLDRDKSKAVLVGVVDEVTPTSANIMKRMRLHGEKEPGEGALFFVLSKDKMECSVACIDQLTYSPTQFVDPVYVTNNCSHIWSGASAETLLSLIDRNLSGTVVNDLGGKINSLFNVECL